MGSASIRQHLLQTLVASANLILFGYLLYNIFLTQDSRYQPTLLRCLALITFPTILAVYAYRRKSVDLSGAISGFVIAFTMLISNYTVFVALLVCYVATNRATRYGSEIKNRFEANFKVGGQRNWLQIISNLGVANLCILIKLLKYGIGDFEIDFQHRFFESMYLVASLGAISCATGDSMSSEIGPVLADGIDPMLITTMKPVPRGTNGGVTFIGVIAAGFGGLMIGFFSWISQLTVPASNLNNNYHSPQWPILLFCLYGGLIGSLVDSILGATCQYTGYDHLRHRIVETKEELNTYVEHITGRPWLTNDDVNITSILLMAVLTPLLASHLWPSGQMLSNGVY